MASLSFSRHLAAFVLLIFFLQPSAADSNSSFSFTEFGKGPKFESNIALYGDAEVVNGGYAVQLTSSVRSSAGRTMYKKPIKLTEGKPQKSVSFSTNFSFSVSTGNGDGLAFVMVPSGFNLSMFANSSFGLSLGHGKGKFKVVAVKFNALRDAKVHVGIDVGSSVSAKVSTSSSKNLNLTSGNKTHAWIDYEAGSNRLEVRLSQFAHPRPADPLLWYPIDLSELWEHEKVFVGLSAMNRNSSQTCLITSWSFEQRHVPHWMHSQPLDPEVFAKNSKPVRVETKKDCVKRVFGAMVFGVACGALASLLALYLWTVFGNRRPVVPEGYAEQPKEFEYDKVKVGVDDKAIEDGKQ
ncbi:hypothetical protein PRUPE_6G268200 [Prunus persica]|uniref:Legume lectin domain-containing protein n=1 Tax=Prunus persica TaxID=3760 RepID=A0A251NWC7_PRUPE|nr:L-type lectin-domain containing receptor kinase VIII.2 [Prunus persica]ONI03603.1 hypothetical protein PRUPE_6G268200 [Prunus persica]